MRKHRRWIWLGIFLLVVVWGALSARALLSARKEAELGLESLDHARDGLTPKDLLRGKGQDALNEARKHFAKAHDEADSFFLTPVKWIPVIGRQAQSVSALSGGAEVVTEVGARALGDANRIVDAVDHPSGAERVKLLRDLGTVAQAAKRDLVGIGLGPDSLLVSPLKKAHDKFDTRLGEVKTMVSDLVDASVGLAEFLQGPRRYLVIAANNSEARAGSGAFLSLGELQTANGKFDLGEMTPANAIQPKPGAVKVTDSNDRDFVSRFGFLNPTADYRELAVTARFDVIAPLAVKMWKSSTGHDVDGVLVLDPVALKALLTATGPVQVDGTEYSKNNVLQEVFVNQYVGITTDVAQIERRDKLSKIARAAIKQLEDGNWDTVELFDALRKAGVGRHLLGWSSRPSENRAWLGAHIGGYFGPDSMLLSVQNRAGNKMDQFLTIDGKFEVGTGADGSSDVLATITLKNSIPIPITKFPPYVIGPYPFNPTGEAGKYEGIFQVELPRLVRKNYLEVNGKRVKQSIAGSNGPDHRVLGAPIALKPGESTTIIMHFTLPKGENSLQVAPTSRVLHPMLGRAAVIWSFDGQTWTDDTSRRVRW